MKRTLHAYAVLASLVGTPAFGQAPAAPAAVPVVPNMANIMAVPADAPPPHTARRGAYKVEIVADPGLPGFTIIRPAGNRGKARPFPVLAWGNGGCFFDNTDARPFLSTIASNGIVVIAPGPLNPPVPAKPDAPLGERFGYYKGTALKTALDWVEKQSANKAGAYYHRLDPTRMAVSGYSCGGLQAIENAADSRVKSVVIVSSGTFPKGMVLENAAATKESIARIHSPTAYLIGGPADVAYPNAEDDYARFPAVPVFKGNINAGHGNTMHHPGGGWFAEAASAWLLWTLNGDKAAARYFKGSDCTLCKQPVWKIERKGL